VFLYMPTETSYTRARADLARLCDRAAADRDVVIIHRRGAADVALIAADELRSLLECAHLLRSPRNAKRLLAALARAQRRGGQSRPVEQLRRELKLGRS
jgi:antitoxin YefM